jgi:DNA-binding NarL/FixJ family response regulator
MRSDVRRLSLITAAEKRMKVIVAADDAVLRAGLVTVLMTRKVDVVGQASDGGRAVELAGRLRPDVVLLDVKPKTERVTAAGPLSEITRVLMLSRDADADVVMAAMCAGAAGYLVHGEFGVDELAAAVRDVLTGRAVPLSPAAGNALVKALRDLPRIAVAKSAAMSRAHVLSRREIDVMDLIAQGHSNGDIARTLLISENTVKNHINRIFAKLGVPTRSAAIAAWLGTAGPGPRPMRDHA